MRWIINALTKGTLISLIALFSANTFALAKFTCTGGRPAWKLDIEKSMFKLKIAGQSGKVFFHSVKPLHPSPGVRVYGTTSYNWIPTKIVVKEQMCGRANYKVNFAYGNKSYSGCCIRGDSAYERMQQDQVRGVVQYRH